MSGHVKMGLLIGAAIIIATAMSIYFSSFQTCVRALSDQGIDWNRAASLCAHSR
jgi:hypothetical protein